jgi:predicted transposase/invertase (TIGR01784 family)
LLKDFLSLVFETEIADRMELWLKFFTVDTEEALLDMEKTNDTAILKASIAVKKMNADERMRELARVREKAQLTQRLVRYEGYNEAKIEDARKMLKKGYPVAEIADITELPLSAINELTAR